MGVDDPTVTTDTAFCIALLAIGTASVVVVGDYAWLVILTLGFTAILVDSSAAMPEPWL